MQIVSFDCCEKYQEQEQLGEENISLAYTWSISKESQEPGGRNGSRNLSTSPSLMIPETLNGGFIFNFVL